MSQTTSLDDVNACLVCFETLDDDTSIRLLCKHKFHKKCIHQWTKKCRISKHTETCPLCRSQVQHDYVTVISLDNHKIVINKDFTYFISHGAIVDSMKVATPETIALFFGSTSATVLFCRYSRVRNARLHASTCRIDDTGKLKTLLAFYSMDQRDSDKAYDTLAQLLKQCVVPVVFVWLDYNNAQTVSSYIAYLKAIRDSHSHRLVC